MCGVQLTIMDVSKSKPLLYQLTWKFIEFIKNKKNETWMHINKDAIVHLPMIFMGKLHQFFQHLASFSQNSINTNKVEIGNSTLEIKHITSGEKLVAKFINKMAKHIDANSVPKEIPAFAKDLAIPDTKSKKQPSTQPAASGDPGKRKASVNKTNLVKRSRGRSFPTRA